MFSPSVEGAIVRVAEEFGYEPEALKAVAWVESAGVPFWTVNGKQLPAMRWEGHYAWRLAGDADRQRLADAGLASPKAQLVRNPRRYGDRYAMFWRGYEIARDVAIMACSWGIGQVMGAHWRHLGYNSPQSFFDTVTRSVEGQVEVMVRYIEANGLRRFLNRRDWHRFAKGYNGSNYKKFKYARKMKTAYRRMKRGATAAEVGARDLQKMLKRLGYYRGKIDGIAGNMTVQAVRDFQGQFHLKVDGKAGLMTMKELREAYDRSQSRDARKYVKAATAAAPVATATLASVSGPGTETSSAAPPEAAGGGLSTDTIVDAIDQAQYLGGRAVDLLTSFNAPVIVMVLAVTGIAAFIVWRCLNDVGEEDDYGVPG